MAQDIAERDARRRLYELRNAQHGEREALQEIRNGLQSTALRMAARLDELSTRGLLREAAKVSAVIGIIIGADAVIDRACEEIKKHG